MTSPPKADPAPTSLQPSASPASSDFFASSPSRPNHHPSATNNSKIRPKSPALDALAIRPGLVSRASESSTKTLQPRHHIRNKSSSLVPTLSTLNVGTAPNSRQPNNMANTTTGSSSGAADLLRQAMTR